MKKVGGVAIALIAVAVLISSTVFAQSPEIGDAAFERLWNRQDRPVSMGQSDRSWTWGPAPISELLDEKYIQGVDGTRRVQYFDKSRMEINDPNADPGSQWYVTNGLLPIEMMTGKVQTGNDFNSEFDMRGPANIPVIGDADNTFPTYADLLPLYQSPGTVSNSDLNQPVTAMLNSDGSVGEYVDHSGDQATWLVQGDNGHGVPAAFMNFMTQEGVVYEGGQLVRRSLYDPPVFVFGLPITKPYWVMAKVGGRELPILFQVFERRVLTYNPYNEAAFRVEMGNVGLHYYRWRYGNANTSEPTPTLEPTTANPTPTLEPTPTEEEATPTLEPTATEVVTSTVEPTESPYPNP